MGVRSSAGVGTPSGPLFTLKIETFAVVIINGNFGMLPSFQMRSTRYN
jgi:hypothetical protein